MNFLKENNFYFKILITIFLALLIVAIFSYLNIYSKTISNQKNFSVNGEGKVIAIPDLAEINIGIISEGVNLASLQRENANKNNDIIKFLKENKIEEKDITTIFYQITPKYKYYNCSYEKICPPAEIAGYTINQNILVKIRDLDKVGLILDGVIQKGANNINGLNFTVSDIEKYKKEARKIAILKAKEKAKEIAKEAGFKLGKIVSFNENVFEPYLPIYQKEYFSTQAIKDGESNLNIEAGSQEIKVNVNLIFEIK